MTLDPSRGDLNVRERTVRSSSRVRLRRAATLILMTLVLPGSAQIAAGNRRIGHLALRVWAAVVSTALLLAVVAVVDRGAILSMLTDPAALNVLRFALLLLAVGWVALFVNAWLLGSPPQLRQGHRLAILGLGTVTAGFTAVALFSASNVVAVQSDLISSVFSAETVSDAEHGRFNVLLLGGDSGADRWGLRPDSLTVASIDAETGRTVLISLPRNLEDVPFPEDSPMHEEFPKGFDCDGCYLNGVNTWAMDHQELYDLPPVQDDGATSDNLTAGIVATTEAVEATTGLKVNYYAMVNLAGFESLVDAVGGVTIDVPSEVPIGGIGAPITGYIEPGEQKLDGFETLWFARSRVADDDYSRMARQKCVMSAMLQQLSPKQVLLHFQDIADSGKELLSTDIPARQLDTFLDLALKARSQKVSTVSIVPPAIDTGDPDFGRIRSMVERGIAASEGEHVGRAPWATLRKERSADEKAELKAKNQTASSTKANDTGDLAASC